MGKRTNIASTGELFVGRVGESAALERALLAGERLLSVIGPSGMGKTRLAREVASRLLPSFAGGGAWFCDLSAAKSREDLLSVVATTLGIPGDSRGEELPLARALANRGRLLLVLDNFEYLEDAALPLVASWLDQASELQLIVTSLVRLGLDGESLFELGPLEPEEAIALYEERAKLAWSGDRLFYSGERQAIDELVHRLDRLPLAIELAAARVRVLPPREMLSRIEERFELLRSKPAGRRSSLEEALTCSWELLEPAERQTLAQSSVFRGGFTLEAAEAVLTLDGGPTMLEALESLRDKALLQLDASNPPRFSLYESVQAFAARELERAGGVEATGRRHSEYFLRCGEAWAEQSRGVSAAMAIERLVGERENLIAVYRRHVDSAPAVAARAALVACVAVSLAGAAASEGALVDDAVAAARRAGDDQLLVRALRTRATALRRYGILDDVRRDIDEALEIVRRIGDRILEGYLLASSVRLCWQTGEREKGDIELERASEIAAGAGDPGLEGRILMSRGLIAESRGKLEESSAFFREAAAIFEGRGELHLHWRALFNMGLSLAAQGKYDEGVSVLREARAISRLTTNQIPEAQLLLAIGTIKLTAGQFDEAEECLEAAYPMHVDLGDLRHEGLALATLGSLALERGELHLARRRFLDSNALLGERADRYRGIFLPFLGAVEAMLANFDEAKACFDEARSIFETQADAANLAATEALEGFLDLAQVRLAMQSLRIEEAEVLRGRAQARYEATLDGPNSHALVRARRLLGNALERFTHQGVYVAPREPSAAPSGCLFLGPDAEWFEVPDHPRVALNKKGTERRMLLALVSQRLCAPGVGLSTAQLFEAGWPDEKALPSAAAARVYSGLTRLRRLGLDSILKSNSDGYALAASIPVSFAR